MNEKLKEVLLKSQETNEKALRMCKNVREDMEWVSAEVLEAFEELEDLILSQVDQINNILEKKEIKWSSVTTVEKK